MSTLRAVWNDDQSLVRLEPHGLDVDPHDGQASALLVPTSSAGDLLPGALLEVPIGGRAGEPRFAVGWMPHREPHGGSRAPAGRLRGERDPCTRGRHSTSDE